MVAEVRTFILEIFTLIAFARAKRRTSTGTTEAIGIPIEKAAPPCALRVVKERVNTKLDNPNEFSATTNTL